jgi:dienelactone hydrolase
VAHRPEGNALSSEPTSTAAGDAPADPPTPAPDVGQDAPPPSRPAGGWADGAAIGAAVGLAVALIGHVGPTAWDVLLGLALTALALALLDGVVALLRWVAGRALRRPLPRASAPLAAARTHRLSFPLTGALLVLTPWVAGDSVVGAVHAGAAGSIVILAATLGGAVLGGAFQAFGPASRTAVQGDGRTTRSRRGWVGVVSGAAGLLVLATLVWLAVPGPGADVVAPTLPADVAPLALADPGLHGPHTVLQATYGSDVDPHRAAFGADATWRTEPVDGSDAGVRFEPLLGPHVWLATRATVERLPVNGTVWYPEGVRGAPLVLLVHGNHGLTRASDRGYAYLAEHLASHGYVAVSVDQNFLNGSFVGDGEGSEHPLRARVLLEHLRGWEAWAGEDGPFAGMVDLERVVLIGHSRGGEAAAHVAAMVADPAQAPEPSWALPADSALQVQAVVAIAPSDRQWVPDGGPRRLDDTNYLLLAGGLDGDVTTLQGMAQYHRADLAPGSAGFTAFAYLQRANHGQFNTVWGRRDAGWLNSTMLDRGALLSGEEQRQAARVLITAFLSAAVQDDDGYRAVFARPDAAKGWLPDDVVVTGYSDGTTRTLSVDATDAEGFEEVERQALRARDGERALETRVWRLGWRAGSTPAVRVAVTEAAVEDRGSEDSEAEGRGAADRAASDVVSVAYGSADLRPPPDMVVEVEDDDGRRASLPLDAATSLRPPLPGRVGKWTGWSERYRVTIDPAWPAEHLLQTYELPLAWFVAEEPGLDLGQPAAVTLRPDGDVAGSVHLGEVALRSRTDAEVAVTGDDEVADVGRGR